MKTSDRVLLAVLRAAVAVVRRAGPVAVSDLGGAIARGIGPLLPVSRVADGNLAATLPALDAVARRRMVRAVWDNLGRTIAEMAVLDRLEPTLTGPGYEVVWEKAAAAADFSRGGILFAGHLGNWELTMLAARLLPKKFAVLFRAPSNAAADVLVRELRARYGGAGLLQFAKGAQGARQSLAHLKAGGILGVLADQKLNDGIAVPFFGRPAMTSPAIASLALRFGLPVLPTRVERLGAARFRLTVEAPLPPVNTGDRHEDIAVMTRAVNETLERWIRARPGQWLWLHRRWP
jgi:KDO2-lipid IV(A) lauroyltransferase